MPLAFGNVENTDFVASASVGAVTSWNFDISALAPASGNLLVLEAFLDSSTQAFAAVSGWTAALNSAASAGTVGVFWKISNGAETTVTLAPAANSYQILGLCKKYTGAHPTTPILVITSSQQAGGSSWNSPSIDTTGTNGCHLCFGGFTQSGTSDWIAGDEPDTTTLVKQATGDTAWWGSAFEPQATGGVSGTRLWTNSAQGKTAYSYAIQPISTTVTGSGALSAQSATMAGTAITFQVVTGSSIKIDSASMYLNLNFPPVDGDKVGIPRNWLGSALTLATDGTFTITPALPNGTEIPRISYDTSATTWYEDVVTINTSGALTIYASGALQAQSATMSGSAILNDDASTPSLLSHRLTSGLSFSLNNKPTQRRFLP